MPLHLLTENASAARQILETKREHAVVWSPNAGVRAPLAGLGAMVRSPERAENKVVYEALWTGSLKAISQINAACKRLATDDAAFQYLSAVLPGQAFHLFNAVGTKAVTIEDWLVQTDRQPRMVIGDQPLTPARDLSARLGRLDSVFAALAAVWPIDVETAEVAVAEGENIVTVPPATTIDRLFAAANTDLSSILFRLWSRLNSPTIGVGDRNVLVFRSNEMIEEAWLSFLSRRYRVGALRPPSIVSSDDGSAPQSFLDNLEEIWRRAAGDALSEPAIAACWTIIGPRLAHFAGAVPGALERVRGWADEEPWIAKSSGRRSVVVSNGLYSTRDRLIDAVLRERSVPVVYVDHGVGGGIGAALERYAHLFTQTSDVYVNHNDGIARLYSANRVRADQIFFAGGTPASMKRCRAQPLQRRVYRRQLGVKADDRMLMYVARLSANNMHQGWGSCTDTAYQHFQAQLLDVLRTFPGRVVVKPYPAHRYADPEPIWLIDESDRFSLAPVGEFRQQRWAADLIVLDLCSSTLGWAMGSDAPIVYVNNESNPALEASARLMHEALFYIEALEAGWSDALKAILLRDAADIESEWAAKGPARRSFETDYVFGPTTGLGWGVRAGVNRAFQRYPGQCA